VAFEAMLCLWIFTVNFFGRQNTQNTSCFALTTICDQQTESVFLSKKALANNKKNRLPLTKMKTFSSLTITLFSSFVVMMTMIAPSTVLAAPGEPFVVIEFKGCANVTARPRSCWTR
jgi:hypothetical protein